MDSRRGIEARRVSRQRKAGARSFRQVPIFFPLDRFGASAYAVTESDDPTMSEVVSDDWSSDEASSSSSVEAFATRSTEPMILEAEESPPTGAGISTRCANAIDTPPESENGFVIEPESTERAFRAAFRSTSDGGPCDVPPVTFPAESSNQIAL